jgi:phage shock protein A
VKLEEQVTNDEDDDDVMQQRTVEQLIDEMIEQRQQLQKSCAELRASKYRFNDDFVDCVHVKD